jgi:hypothetical protein
VQYNNAGAFGGYASVPVLFGGTGATTAGYALYNLMGAPSAGTYSTQCSGTSCAPTTASGGFPLSYACTGNATTDLAAINADLAIGGVYLYVTSLIATCPTSGQVILFSSDTLDLSSATLDAAIPKNNTVTPGFAITNNAVVNPTTIARTCTLAAGSTTLTGCSGTAFTASPFTGAPNGDMEQSFSCPGALGGGVNLQTSIGQINSGTSVTLVDPTGSGITPGSYSCTEQIRDHDMTIIGGQISLTGTGSASQLPFMLGIGHANKVRVEGGNWLEPDSTSSWHMVFWDVNHITAQNLRLINTPGEFGTDGIDFEGPWLDVNAENIFTDMGDDAIAPKPGEWISSLSAPFLNTSGSGHGGHFLNLQGSGSAGVHFYLPSCVNASGTCISSTVTDVVVDTVIGQAVHTGTSSPSISGFVIPVVFQCANGAASDCGTTAYEDRISLAHIIGTASSGAVGAARVVIGNGAPAANQYYKDIAITDVGPDNSTYGGDFGAITAQGPTNMSFTTTVTNLSIYDTNYTGNHGLFGASNSNVTLNNFSSDNTNSANYSFTGALLNNPHLGYQQVYTNQANAYGAFLQDFSNATIELPVAAGYTGGAPGQIGFDSTNVNWRAFIPGIGDMFMALFPTSGITSGDCVALLKTTNRWSLQDVGFACGSGGDTITSPNLTLIVGGTSSATTLDLNLAHSNTWSANQTYLNASINFQVSSPSNPAVTIANTGVTASSGTGQSVAMNSAGITIGTGPSNSNFWNTNGGVTTGTGTGNVVLSTSPTLVTPALGTPSSANLSNATSLPAASVKSGALANGMTATTQTTGDNTNKLATDAFVVATAAPALGNNVPETTSWTLANNTVYRFTGSGASNATTPASVSSLALAAIWNQGSAAVTVVTGGPTLVCMPSSCVIPIGSSASITTDGTNFDVQISNALGSAFGTAANANTTGAGAAVPTGPTSTTSLDVVEYTGTAGQQADSGVAVASVAIAPVNGAVSSATGGSGTGTVTCLTASCTNVSGSYSVSGGTFTTGNLLVLVWPTTTTAYKCITSQNGGVALYGIGHSVATATGMTITAGISVLGVTVTIDYSCSKY